MSDARKPDIELVRKCFGVTKEGVVFNRIDRCNSAKAGRPSGTVNLYGYVVINFMGRLWQASHISYAIANGEWPTLEVDHCDRNKRNNRPDNLRQVTAAENTYNQNLRSTNSSGVKGVRLLERTGRWQARACVGAKEIHLGYFATKEEAAKARADWEASFIRPVVADKGGLEYADLF